MAKIQSHRIWQTGLFKLFVTKVLFENIFWNLCWKRLVFYYSSFHRLQFFPAKRLFKISETESFRKHVLANNMISFSYSTFLRLPIGVRFVPKLFEASGYFLAARPQQITVSERKTHHSDDKGKNSCKQIQKREEKSTFQRRRKIDLAKLLFFFYIGSNFLIICFTPLWKCFLWKK